MKDEKCLKLDLRNKGGWCCRYQLDCIFYKYVWISSAGNNDMSAPKLHMFDSYTLCIKYVFAQDMLEWK